MNEHLVAQLRDAVPGSRVDAVGEAIRVLVPNPRWAHDYVSVSVEPVEGGWLLSDLGELRGLADDDTPALVRLLECAGADLALADGGQVTSEVAADDPLATRVLAFAHYLVAAPVVWHARDCMSASEGEPVAESPVRALAKEAKQRLVGRLGQTASPVIHLNRRLKARGESVRAPLTISAPSLKSMPRLVAAFVDMQATDQAVSAAKRVASWTFEVVHEIHIPKYLVVQGSDADVAHFGDFYDHHNVVAVNFGDGQQFVEDSRAAVQSLGLATSP